MNTQVATPKKESSLSPKVPPYSIEAEQSVLGALMLDNRAWDRVIEHMGVDDFYRNEHKVIFTTIQKFLSVNDEHFNNMLKRKHDYNFDNNTKEIILISNTSLYSFPETNSKELLVLDMGTSLSILHNWIVSESEIWLRVELPSNKLLDDPNKITKGWIKV